MLFLHVLETNVLLEMTIYFNKYLWKTSEIREMLLLNRNLTQITFPRKTHQKRKRYKTN